MITKCHENLSQRKDLINERYDKRNETSTRSCPLFEPVFKDSTTAIFKNSCCSFHNKTLSRFVADSTAITKGTVQVVHLVPFIAFLLCNKIAFFDNDLQVIKTFRRPKIVLAVKYDNFFQTISNHTYIGDR